MHRSTFCGAALAAATLTTLLLLGHDAGAEPDGSTLGTNRQVYINTESNESPASAAAVEPASAHDTPRDADAEQPIAGDHRDDADGESPASAFPDASAQESQPLVTDGKAVQRPAGSDPNAEASGSRSLVNEQARGLSSASDDEAESGSRFTLPFGGGNDIVQVVGALAIVITLLVAFRFIMVRASSVLNGGRPSGVLEILARYPVARGQHLSLIKLGRRVLLVHQAGSSMTTLTEVTDATEVAALLSRIEAGSSGRDAERFRSLLNQYQREQETLSRRKPSEQTSGRTDTPKRDADGEVIDLTRSQMGGLRNLFGYGGGKQ